MRLFKHLFTLMLQEDEGGGGETTTEAPADPPPEISLPDDVPKYMAQGSREQKENKEILEWSKQFDKFPDLVNAAYESQTKLKSITPVPGENATDEEKRTFLKALGVPDKPEEYEFDAELSEEDAAEIKKLAHSNGLTPTQAKAMAKAYADIKEGAKINAEENLKRKNEEAIAALKEEWGEANFEKNMEIMGRAARAYFVVDENSVLNGELGSDPKILRGLYRIGKDMVDTPLGPNRSSTPDKEKDKKAPKTFEYPT